MKWQTIGRHVVHVLLKDKGSMVNPDAGAKFINVSQVSVLWYTPDSEDLEACASPTMGEIDGGPVLYVATTGRVVCLGLDGGIKWSTDVGWAWDFAPSLSNDGSRLYLASDEYGLFCLDARTGAVLWSADIPGYLGTVAVGPGGVLYCQIFGGFDDSTFVAQVRDCGDSAHVEWRTPFPFEPTEGGWSMVVGANGTSYAECRGSGQRRGAIVAIDTNGTVLWQDTTHIGLCGWMYAPVIDSRGRLITGDDNANLFCFNPDGTLAWSVNTGWGMMHGGITVGYDDRIYFQSEDGRLYCYDSDGRQVWTGDIPEELSGFTSPCALSDSTILIYSGGYAILSCFSWDGELLWTYSVDDSIIEPGLARGPRDEGDGETTPVVGPDGNVYVSNDWAVIGVAIGQARLANTAWPTYNHDNARSGWAGRH